MAGRINVLNLELDWLSSLQMKNKINHLPNLLSKSNWNLEMLVFEDRGGNWSTLRKTSRSKDKNQQQNQPTYDAESGNQTRATLVGGEYSHYSAIPAPPPPPHPLPALIPLSCTQKILFFSPLIFPLTKRTD